MTSLPKIRDLIPHEPPMVWLDELLEWRPGFARCRARIEPSSPFVRDGRLSSVALLEHMAQGVATCLGYAAHRKGESVRVGLVIACRTFELHRPDVPVGTSLVIETQRIREMDEVSHFDGRVWLDESVVASAHLLLYHAARPPA